jgi:hypothetical protein
LLLVERIFRIAKPKLLALKLPHHFTADEGGQKMRTVLGLGRSRVAQQPFRERGRGLLPCFGRTHSSSTGSTTPDNEPALTGH